MKSFHLSKQGALKLVLFAVLAANFSWNRSMIESEEMSSEVGASGESSSAEETISDLPTMKGASRVRPAASGLFKIDKCDKKARVELYRGHVTTKQLDHTTIDKVEYRTRVGIEGENLWADMDTLVSGVELEKLSGEDRRKALAGAMESKVYAAQISKVLFEACKEKPSATVVLSTDTTDKGESEISDKEAKEDQRNCKLNDKKEEIASGQERIECVIKRLSELHKDKNEKGKYLAKSELNRRAQSLFRMAQTDLRKMLTSKDEEIADQGEELGENLKDAIRDAEDMAELDKIKTRKMENSVTAMIAAGHEVRRTHEISEREKETYKEAKDARERYDDSRREGDFAGTQMAFADLYRAREAYRQLSEGTQWQYQNVVAPNLNVLRSNGLLESADLSAFRSPYDKLLDIFRDHSRDIFVDLGASRYDQGTGISQLPEDFSRFRGGANSRWNGGDRFSLFPPEGFNGRVSVMDSGLNSRMTVGRPGLYSPGLGVSSSMLPLNRSSFATQPYTSMNPSWNSPSVSPYGRPVASPYIAPGNLGGARGGAGFRPY